MERIQTATRPAARKEGLRRAWSEEMGRAREARDRGDSIREWSHLERAHILSQPMALPHVRTHVAMMGSALRRRDRKEIVGQLVRLVLAGPGSVSGRYPVGNTGGADVSAFAPMPIPDDLRAILDSELEEATR
jgi:hypothetical protein